MQLDKRYSEIHKQFRETFWNNTKNITENNLFFSLQSSIEYNNIFIPLELDIQDCAFDFIKKNKQQCVN